MELGRNAVAVGEIAGLVDEQAQFGALSGKFASHRMAYKAGRACDKDFHSMAYSVGLFGVRCWDAAGGTEGDFG